MLLETEEVLGNHIEPKYLSTYLGIVGNFDFQLTTCIDHKN